MDRLPRKAIMGVGMLLLFVSTILVSAVAAGVLIRATGVMQESTLDVADQARTRLITGIDAFTVYAYGNSSADKIYGLELYTRLRAGSPPLQMDNMGLSYVSGDNTFSAELNESLVGDDCQFDSLSTREQFCFVPLNGNNDTILQQGELYAIRYNLGNGSARLDPEEDFEITLQPKRGSLESISATIPDLILDAKLRIR